MKHDELPPPTLSAAFDTERGLLDTWRLPLEPGVFDGRAHPGSLHWLRRNAVRLAVFSAVVVTMLVLALALVQPWIGLRLLVHEGRVQVLSVVHGGPAEAAGLSAGMRLLALSSPDAALGLELLPSDLLENPDRLHSYAAWTRFYERQDRLVQLLRGERLRLHVQDPREPAPRVLTVQPAPERPLGNLPPTVWYLVLVQAAVLLIAGRVIAVYPPQPATRYSVVAALAVSVGIGSVAVFSTRELALPSGLFHVLVVLSHLGNLLAVLGLVAVMTYFPTRLRETGDWRAALVPGAYLLWALADALWWLPSPDWAHRAALVSALVLLLLQVVRQYGATMDDPPARAEVRAGAWPWVLGTACIVLPQEGALLLGWTPPVPQTWWFGLVFVAVAGRAMAHRQVRAVDIDDWTRQALLTWGAGLGVLLCYRLLLASQWMSEQLAMLAAVLVFGLLYVPLSSSLWARSILRRGPTPRDLTSGILALGLTTPEEREPLWVDLLQHTFEARRVPPADGVAGQPSPVLVADGRVLWVPPVAGLPGLALARRHRGARLFTRGDRRLAKRLRVLAAQIIQTREAYVRGASEERERIADDLHDDLGAKLLSLAHAGARSAAGVEVNRLAREALEELRLSVRHLKAQPLPLADVLADWRAEAVQRLTAAGIEVDWDAQVSGQPAPLSGRASSQLTRVLREAVSNVIRHSGGALCRVLLQVRETDLHLEVEDNGGGMATQDGAAAAGNGLDNIERRVRRLGGTHRFATGTLGGTLLMVHVPLEPPRTRQAGLD